MDGDAQSPAPHRPPSPGLPGPDRTAGHAAGEPLVDEALCFVEGRWVRRDVGPPASPCCYTTGRVEGGTLRHATRVIARWVRDAAALGLPTIDPVVAHAAYAALATQAFGPKGSGIVRLDARAEGPWTGTPRPIGPEAASWRAAIATAIHPGPNPALGAKRADLSEIAEAREERAERYVDEMVLLDGAQSIVEGARANLIAVDAGGALITPPLSSGPVAGVAREILLEGVPELCEREIGLDELGSVREWIAVNAVRGARPVTHIDAIPVGDGQPGPWAARLDRVLSRAD